MPNARDHRLIGAVSNGKLPAIPQRGMLVAIMLQKDLGSAMHRALATLFFIIGITGVADAQDIRTTRFNTPEGKEGLATLINLNGRLCARVLEISGNVERPTVKCIESRGGLTEVVYVIDMQTGKVLR